MSTSGRGQQQLHRLFRLQVAAWWNVWHSGRRFQKVELAARCSMQLTASHSCKHMFCTMTRIPHVYKSSTNHLFANRLSGLRRLASAWILGGCPIRSHQPPHTEALRRGGGANYGTSHVKASSAASQKRPTGAVTCKHALNVSGPSR